MMEALDFSELRLLGNTNAQRYDKRGKGSAMKFWPTFPGGHTMTFHKPHAPGSSGKVDRKLYRKWGVDLRDACMSVSSTIYPESILTIGQILIYLQMSKGKVQNPRNNWHLLLDAYV